MIYGPGGSAPCFHKSWRGKIAEVKNAKGGVEAERLLVKFVMNKHKELVF